MSTYNYVPPFHGNNQIGRPGEHLITYSDNTQTYSAIILEEFRVPGHWQKDLLEKESYYADYQESYTFGKLKLLAGPRKL